MSYVPTFHLNGTHKQTLIDQQRKVIDTLILLLQDLANAAPHARDYYPQKDPDAFTKAQFEHRTEMAMAQSLLDETRTRLEKMLTALDSH